VLAVDAEVAALDADAAALDADAAAAFFEDNAAVALATAFAATATSCVNAGTNRVLQPPFLNPVVASSSSVTVDPSPPTVVLKVTLLIIIP
jgi:hypothetical protein